MQLHISQALYKLVIPSFNVQWLVVLSVNGNESGCYSEDCFHHHSSLLGVVIGEAKDRFPENNKAPHRVTTIELPPHPPSDLAPNSRQIVDALLTRDPTGDHQGNPESCEMSKPQSLDKLVLSVVATLLAAIAFGLIVSGSFVPRWARPLNMSMSEGNITYSLWGQEECFGIICSVEKR
ncbi:hypothetical protein RRG08_065518 [Elysia crispata]|uniref:Uncharacterized protein n=1 Tax=Elysia crispata TaxID=231223 RepID=A0AAE1B5Z9_9GAST|nr:hypothetical protein RRG08_065518 [Elysia crispata]